jgi:CSLREA domain-containing protein
MFTLTRLEVRSNAKVVSGRTLATATTIVNYNFNSGSSFAALTPTLASGVTSTASSTQPFVTIAGTVTDASAFTANNLAQNALAMADTTGTNTRYFQFQLGGPSLIQNRNYKVYVQASRTASAASTLTLAYSTNGSTFTNLATTLSPGIGTYTSQVFDLSSVAGLNHQPSVYFRLLVSGASSSSFGLAIDNFQVQAETITCPSSLTVNSTLDTSDVAPGDGSCDDGSGNCTLRAALQESNALTFCGAADINFNVRGTINLGGPLPTITKAVNLNGPAANALVINGNHSFRLLNILLTTAATMNINDLSFSGGGKGAGENAAAIEFNNNGTLNLNRLELFDNVGPANGAADGSSVIFSNASAALNLLSCTLRNNQVEHVMTIGNTPFFVTNSTISNNGGTGAAVFIFGGTQGSMITASTITNNNQGLWHANGSGASTVTIRNDIFSQNGNINLRRTGAASCAENGILSSGFNLIDNNPGSSLCTTDASDLIGTSFNPQLSALGYYGGTTQTRPPALISPVIDKGKSFSLTADQRGGGRTRDLPSTANAAGGDGTDIGAVENGLIVNSLADTGDATPDSICDNGSGICTLREALQEANFNAGGETITFAANLTGTINLGSSLPTITQPVNILGPGANSLVLSGNGSFRLMNILLSSPGAVTIYDLGFTGGGKGAGQNATAIEFNNNGTLNLNRDEFFNNTGPANGAADGSSVIFSNASVDLNLTSCTARQNQVEHVIMIGDTPFTISNSTISNNSGTGAAIFLFGGTLNSVITASTITNNNQGLWHANSDVPSTVTIRNSIFSQNGNINLRRTGSATCAENGILSSGYNLIDNDPGSNLCSSDATDLIGTSFNPQLTPLANYGGPTQTRALLAGSPVIDKGNRFGLTTDQRGQTRPFDNPAVPPASGGDQSDIGAFELQAACNPIGLTPSNLPNWNTSTPYNQTLTATGGNAAYTFKVVTGSLPNGVTLSPGGSLTGTPTATGTFNFTILATDASGCYGLRSYSITISNCTTISLSPASLPNGAQGVSYNQKITASGGTAPYTFSFTGSLPAGLSLSSAGVLSGTPTAVGVFNFTVKAISNSNGCPGTQNYQITIAAPPSDVALSNSSVAENAAINTAVGTFSTTDADSSNFTYTLVAGSGSNDNASFVISGNQLLTNAVFDFETRSSYSIRVRTSDETSLVFEKQFNISISNVNEAPTISHISNQVISVGGNTNALALTIGDPETAPAALTVTGVSNNPAVVSNDAAHITFAGTGSNRSVTITPLAQAIGTAVITITVNDGTLTASDQFEVRVDCSSITLGALPDGLAHMSYTHAITASGGTGSYTFAMLATALPPGLGLSSSGILSGVPTATGKFSFDVTVTDTNTGCTGSRSYQLVIGDLVTAGQVIISEFRFRGPDADGAGPLAASANEFIEFYNTTNSDITVSTGDGSAGWALAASDSEVKFVIPNGTVIPAQGHFLAVNISGYGLDGSAIGDSLLLPDGVTQATGYALDIPDGAGIALFNSNTTFTAATRLDAAGFANVSNALYHEGTGLDPASGITADSEMTFVRRFVNGLYTDTDNNSTDFLFLSTDGGVYNGRQSLLGAPGPQNTSSPRNQNTSILLTLLDPLGAPSAAPNRVRDLTSNPTANATFGTISIRRRVTNNTGLPITQLRFRVTDITSYPSQNAAEADVRAISSESALVTLSDASIVQVLGTTLETPPVQSLGGGVNATLAITTLSTTPSAGTLPGPRRFAGAAKTITLDEALAPGDSVNVQFVLGVQKTGLFRFFVNVEALALAQTDDAHRLPSGKR